MSAFVLPWGAEVLEAPKGEHGDTAQTERFTQYTGQPFDKLRGALLYVGICAPAEAFEAYSAAIAVRGHGDEPH